MMQKLRKAPCLTIVLSTCASLVTLSTGALADTKRKEILPTGTVIPVKMISELNSRTSHPGDKFSAIVRYGRDDSDMPEGTKVIGVVREALPTGDGKPGVLDLDITRIVFPSGEARPIEASLVSLDKKN